MDFDYLETKNSFVLAVRDNPGANGSLLQVQRQCRDTSQHWKLLPDGALLNTHLKALAVPGNSQDEGVEPIIYEKKNKEDGQKWYREYDAVEYDDTQWFRFRNGNGLFLSVANDSTEEYAHVCLRRRVQEQGQYRRFHSKAAAAEAKARSLAAETEKKEEDKARAGQKSFAIAESQNFDRVVREVDIEVAADKIKQALGQVIDAFASGGVFAALAPALLKKLEISLLNQTREEKLSIWEADKDELACLLVDIVKTTSTIAGKCCFGNKTRLTEVSVHGKIVFYKASTLASFERLQAVWAKNALSDLEALGIKASE